jgi:hypothetical protein
MGQSTDGQICFGIKFDEGFEFPWKDDLEDFWLEKVLGFQRSFQLFDNDGEYIDGIKPPQSVIDKYLQEKSDFEESHPQCPFELVNYCSWECPEYILAIKRTCKSANRGYPDQFDPSTLTVTKEEIESLIDFCHKHEIICESEPAWYLSSYWG